MDKKHLLLATLFGVVIGCATTQVTQVATSNAQPAGSGSFHECVAYTLGFDGDYEDLAENSKVVDGWTPVGGFGDQAHGRGVILCR